MRLTRTAARGGRLRRNGRERRDCAAGGAGLDLTERRGSVA